MSSLDEALSKLREERAARQKARIETLRELNLKKYSKNGPQTDPPANAQRHIKSNSVSQIRNNNTVVKNNFHVNGTTKRPITAPLQKKEVADVKKKITKTAEPKGSRPVNYILKNIVASTSNVRNAQASTSGVSNIGTPSGKTGSKLAVKSENKDLNTKKPFDTKIPAKINSNRIVNQNLFERKPAGMDKVLAEIKPFKPIDPQLTRKSMAAIQPSTSNIRTSRKSMLPQSTESVFERLSKPKTIFTKTSDVEKLHNDPTYLKKVIAKASLITKRHTCFAMDATVPVRRSISAVHFKKVSKNELGNCIHKWSSIGDKLNQQHLTIDEEDGIKQDKIISAIKSERKKVTFMTPMSHLNTPRPDELQARLKAWLQKRGKSLHSYQHLQCFGMHQITRIKPMEMDDTLKHYDEENKENIAVDSDTDDDSFKDISSDNKDTLCQRTKIDITTWRPANNSMRSEFNDTPDLNETTVTSADTLVNVDELLNGALNDLTELLREGFEWEQGARYLRAIRGRFPAAPQIAAYWECRAALEESRGDLHRSVECWEQAIAKGTETKTAEANIDTLLNKFMQLKISPNSGVNKHPDPKMVDVKNVFKSTIIRFAMAQAKLKHPESPEFIVTPVRRSVRLSLHTPRDQTPSNKTPCSKMPLRLYDSVMEIKTKHVFEPNPNIAATP